MHPLLIDHGHMGYHENETFYDPTVPESVKAIEGLVNDACQYALDSNLSLPAWAMLDSAVAKGQFVHDAVAPHMNSDHHVLLRKFKAAFDPNHTSDSTYHIEAE